MAWLLVLSVVGNMLNGSPVMLLSQRDGNNPYFWASYLRNNKNKFIGINIRVSSTTKESY
jgi:hypothetical protein